MYDNMAFKCQVITNRTLFNCPVKIFSENKSSSTKTNTHILSCGADWKANSDSECGRFLKKL